MQVAEGHHLSTLSPYSDVVLECKSRQVGAVNLKACSGCPQLCLALTAHRQALLYFPDLAWEGICTGRVSAAHVLVAMCRKMSKHGLLNVWSFLAVVQVRQPGKS